MNDLLDCTVENSIHLPDVCTLRFHDAQFRWLDAPTFREGTPVEVWGGDETASILSPLFHGEVTGLEMDLAAHGVPTLVVRCYSRSHRLHRGRYQRSFVQMTDSDIFSKIASEVGFRTHADATSQVHDWVFQNNQTNWEFLNERAAYNGFRLFCRGERDLYFAQVTDRGDGCVKLDWGMDLRSFRPRTAAGTQVDEVVVRGWDPKTKRTIIGKCKKASGVPQTRENASGSDIANKAYGGAKMVVVDRPVNSQGEADTLARSICDDIGTEFLEAEGLCYGQPNMLPGCMVEIDNIGQRFSGQYFVTSTTHTYTPAEGYTTLFSVSGKRPSTLLALLDMEIGGKPPRLGGNIVVGIVTDNNDPDDLGRVRVQYPWLTEEHTSYWARQAVPMGGPGRGFYFLPEIDDEVLVAFEHGDIRRPYLIGALWNGRDKPVEGNSVAVKAKQVVRRTIKTRIGHTLLLDDTDGKGEIRLTTCNGHELTLNDRDQQILARTKQGHQVLMDDRGGKIVIVDKSGNNKMTITTGDNSMSMECMGNFSINAKGKVSVEGTQGIEMKTPAQMDLEASVQMNVKSSGMATVQAGGVLTVQGSLVKIN